MSKPIKVIEYTSAAEVARAVLDAVDAKPGDTIEIAHSQCEREPGYSTPGCAPATLEGWAALPSMSEVALREMGLRPWGTSKEDDDGNESGPMLWLFPGEWYTAIPAGLEVVDIFFRQERFIPGETDDDIRYGCLSYGVLVEKREG